MGLTCGAAVPAGSDPTSDSARVSVFSTLRRATAASARMVCMCPSTTPSRLTVVYCGGAGIGLRGMLGIMPRDVITCSGAHRGTPLVNALSLVKFVQVRSSNERSLKGERELKGWAFPKRQTPIPCAEARRGIFLDSCTCVRQFVSGSLSQGLSHCLQAIADQIS